jgi:chromosome segregation ATPase
MEDQYTNQDYTKDLASTNRRLLQDREAIRAENKRLRLELSGYQPNFGKTEAQTIAALRAKLKQAEEEALEFDQKIENAYQAWKDVYEQLAAKDGELADLTACYKALGKKASQYEDQRDENARLCLYWEELFNWASDRNYDLVMDIAETNRELDDAVELLKVLGQQQMDDFKAHKAELDLYRKAVEPVKEADNELLCVMITDKVLPKEEQKRVAGVCVKAVRDCIRTLGEGSPKAESGKEGP